MEITMKTKQLLLFAALTLFSAAHINAQQQTDSRTTVSYQVNIMDYSDCSCEHVPMQVSASQFALQYGHNAGARFQLNHSLSYKHHDKGFRGFFDLGDHDEVVLHGHIYSYQTGARYAFSNKWAASGYFKPQLRSYLEKHERSFYTDYEGGAMLEYNTGSGWIFGAGYAYSRNLSEGLVHPTILLDYNNQNNFRTTIYFPEFAEVWFIPGNRFGFGMVAVLDGDEFKGIASVYNDVMTSVQYADFTVGPAIELNVSGMISLNMKAAYTAGRHLVIESVDTRESLNPSPTWGISAGIQLRLQ